MRREIVLDLLELVSENLRNTSLLHSQIACQLQELESREFSHQDKNIQGMRQILIARGKLINLWYRYKESILFTLKKNKIFYFCNRRKIVRLLKKYSWDSQDKIQETFHTCNECLLDLEKKIPDYYYPLVELPEKEDFGEEFRQLGQNPQSEYRDNTLIKIAYILMAKHLIDEPKQESDSNILSHSNSVYSHDNILTKNQYFCFDSVNKDDDIPPSYCRVFTNKETVYQ